MVPYVLMFRFHCFQDLYSAAPVALAPFLGNPVLLAAFGIDKSAPFLDQVIFHSSKMSSVSTCTSFSVLPFIYASQHRQGSPLLVQLQQFAEGVRSLLPQLQAIAEILPAPTLEWKLKLLEEGSRYPPLSILRLHAMPSCPADPLLFDWSAGQSCVTQFHTSSRHSRWLTWFLQDCGADAEAGAPAGAAAGERGRLADPFCRGGAPPEGAAAPLPAQGVHLLLHGWQNTLWMSV